MANMSDDDDDDIEAIVRKEQLKWKTKADHVEFKGKSKTELYKEARKIALMIEKVTVNHRWDTAYYYLLLYVNICMKNNLHRGDKSDKDVAQVLDNLKSAEKRVERAKRGMLYQYKYHSELEAREIERKHKESQARAAAASTAIAAGATVVSAVASTTRPDASNLTYDQLSAAMDALRLPGQANSKIPEAIIASHAPAIIGKIVSEPAPEVPPPPYPGTKVAAVEGFSRHHGGMSADCSIPDSKVLNLILKPVTGDGSCAFRAIAQGMHKGSLSNDREKQEADKLRQLVVRLLQQRGGEEMVGSGMTIEQVVLMKDNYTSYTAYCGAMARSEYAGETEFWLLSEELDLRIAIFMSADDDKGGLEHLITYGTASTLPVCLYWQRGGKSELGNHYDCLLYED